jgi:hypothetical protein
MLVQWYWIGFVWQICCVDGQKKHCNTQQYTDNKEYLYCLWHCTRHLYRVIRLWCHKKKRKHCRKESTLLPVNGTYTCRWDTTFVSQHINVQHDRHGGRGTVHTVRKSCATWCAAFPEWSVRGYVHFVVFIRTQVTWRTPTRKSLAASSLGNSRAMGWAHHGRISDFCMCRLKTPRLPCTLNHGLPNVFLPVPVSRSSVCVRHSQTFPRNMYHFSMSRCKGTW